MKSSVSRNCAAVVGITTSGVSSAPKLGRVHRFFEDLPRGAVIQGLLQPLAVIEIELYGDAMLCLRHVLVRTKFQPVLDEANTIWPKQITILRNKIYSHLMDFETHQIFAEAKISPDEIDRL